MAESKQFHQIFSENAEEQREQLKENQLMKEYAEYREKCKGDITNPAYHFYAPDGEINDPNGFCYWNGKYHMFYQQYPPASDKKQHWGHAISDDMVHWEDLPTAIYTSIEDACFSGNTLVEDDRVIAAYYGTHAGEMIATSHDPLLLNWEKDPANPVIKMDPDMPYRICDPFLWKEDDGYYMISGTHINEFVRFELFFSQDLTRWIYLGLLMDENNPFIEFPNDGACPYFLPFGENEHMLLFFSHRSGPRALVGKYDKVMHKFKANRSVVFSRDRVATNSIVAPCAISDGKGGIYVIYNMGEGRKNTTRMGVFTLMRHLTPGPKGRVHINPVETVKSLRKSLLLDEQNLSLTANTKTPIAARGKCIEIEATIDMKGARALQFRVLCDPAGKEYTDITVYITKNVFIDPIGHVTVDTTHSSLFPDLYGRLPSSMQFMYDKGEPVNIRIFVDNSVVEVFVNEKAVLSHYSYASLPESDGVSIEAIGDNAEVTDIKVWELGGIY